MALKREKNQASAPVVVDGSEGGEIVHDDPVKKPRAPKGDSLTWTEERGLALRQAVKDIQAAGHDLTGASIVRELKDHSAFEGVSHLLTVLKVTMQLNKFRKLIGQRNEERALQGKPLLKQIPDLSSKKGPHVDWAALLGEEEG